MSERKKFSPSGSSQERMKLPDDEVQSWIQLFRENNFSDEEIDRIIVWLNDEYARIKLPNLVNEEVKRILDSIAQKGEKQLSPKEIEDLREQVRKDLRPR